MWYAENAGRASKNEIINHISPTFSSPITAFIIFLLNDKLD